MSLFSSFSCCVSFVPSIPGQCLSLSSLFMTVAKYFTIFLSSVCLCFLVADGGLRQTWRAFSSHPTPWCATGFYYKVTIFSIPYSIHLNMSHQVHSTCKGRESKFHLQEGRLSNNRWLLKPPCMRAKLLQSCPTLGNPIDYSPSDSSVHWILQARILEWVAMPSSRGSFQRRCQTWVSCMAHEGSLTLAPPAKPKTTIVMNKYFVTTF